MTTTRVTQPPEFGAPCAVAPRPEALELLARRRSSSAQTLAGPGPTPGEVEDLLRLAARVPDHGKLAPWRFIVIAAERKPGLIAELKLLARSQEKPGKAEAVLGKLAAPPLTIAVVSAPCPGPIPVWEQELSAGAVCMALLVAADAMGYGANWITDWYSYEPAARPLFGLADGERIAGFIHIGRPSEPALERVRPELPSRVAVF